MRFGALEDEENYKFFENLIVLWAEIFKEKSSCQQVALSLFQIDF